MTAQQSYKQVECRIFLRIEQNKSDLFTARDNLIENLDVKDPSYHGIYWEVYSRVQIESQVWERVEEIMENRNIGLVEATKLVREQIVDDFIRERTFTPHSTNALINHVEALKNEVVANWVWNLEYLLS